MKKVIIAACLMAASLAAIAQTSKCIAFTKKGTQCTRNAVVNGYCKQHNPQATRCKGKKQDGTPCNLIPKAGSEYCHFHQPKNK